jgi:hypothetical protein
MDALRRVGLVTGVALATLATWAAFAPLHVPSRDVLFEIPRGTWASRRAGNAVEILPSRIRLTLGLRDTLVLRNLDEVPQVFGPTLMMPGQSFSLPFAVAADYQFACTAHASGQMTIVVEPMPVSPWARLAWRVSNLTGDIGWH